MDMYELFRRISEERSEDNALISEDDPSKFEYSEEVIDASLITQMMRVYVLKQEIEEIELKYSTKTKEIKFRIAELSEILTNRFPDIATKFKSQGFRVFKGKAYLVGWDKK